jgi:Halobacterial output domain 1
MRAHCDLASKAPSTAVAEAVAAAANSEVNEMEPPYMDIEPDALDALVSPKEVDRCETTESVSFSYDGYDVTVLHGGEISVRKNNSE